MAVRQGDDILGIPDKLVLEVLLLRQLERNGVLVLVLLVGVLLLISEFIG